MASEGKVGFGVEVERTYKPEDVQQLGKLALHDFTNEGGLASIDGQAVSILPHILRKDEARDPLNPYNVMKFQTGDPERKVDWRDLSRNYSGLGKEMEAHVVDGSGNPHDVADIYKRAASEGEILGIGVSPELFRYTLEIGTNQPAETLGQLQHQVTEGLVFMDDMLNEADKDLYLLPTSTIPGYDVDLDRDITKHPYVERMAYEVLGRESVENFTGVGPQLHVETPSHVHGARALMWTENALMPLKALSQSSPYDGSSLKYDAHDRLAHAPETAHRDGNWANLRDLQRAWGLGTGGVVTHTPENVGAFSDADTLNEFINERNRTTFADRAFGGHSKRLRTTLSGAESGTLEIPDFDTAGFRVERLMALDEVTKHAVRAMMQVDPQDAGQQEYLEKRYPAVFYRLTEDADTKRIVRHARRNQYTLARSGKQADLIGADTMTYSIKQALHQLYAFCFEINGVAISKTSRSELDKALQEISSDQPIEEYYRTGHGTFNEAYRAELATIKGEKTEQGQMLATNRVASAVLKSYLSRKRKAIRK